MQTTRRHQSPFIGSSTFKASWDSWRELYISHTGDIYKRRLKLTWTSWVWLIRNNAHIAHKHYPMNSNDMTKPYDDHTYSEYCVVYLWSIMFINSKHKETNTLRQRKYMQICRVLDKLTTLIEEFWGANTNSIMTTDYNLKTVIFLPDICYLASVH